MRRSDFELSAHSPSYYLNLFDAAEFQVSKKSADDVHTETHQSQGYEAILNVGDESSDVYFEIYVELPEAFVPLALQQRARLVVSNIVEMDASARQIPADNGENEQLAYIRLINDEIRFRYWATSFNTEWDVVFKIDGTNKWKCIGIPDFRKPGSYIR